MRHKWLAGFAAGGEWDTCPPSAELARVLEAVSGAEWHCPGASDDEMVGVVRRWAAIESWAGAAKLGVVRALIRAEDKPRSPTDQHVDQPDMWSESLTHELALALAVSVGSADRTAWLAWELGTRLPRIDALLTDGILTYGKAKAVAEAFEHLSDAHAAHAEALIAGQLAGKTYLQVLRLATSAASKADPEGDERRRKDAEQHAARVRLWREQSGAAALAGFDLPTDEALAAHANVSARAEQYKTSGVFQEARMDQLRALAFLDLLNGVTAEARIANARAQAGSDGAANPSSSAVTGKMAADPANGAPDSGGPANGGPDSGGPANAAPDSGGPDSGGSDSDGPDGTGSGEDRSPGGRGPDGGQPAGPSLDPNGHPIARPGTDLVIPLATLLGLGNRPGESHRFGPLDPALCRDLAALAASSPVTRLCVTVTDPDGTAIGHGCARPHRTRQDQAAKQAGKRAEQDSRSAVTAFPARVNLTIPLTDLRNLANLASTGPGSRGSPWAFSPRVGDPDPLGGYGTWTLVIPGGRELALRLERVPTFGCDHAHESLAYQANDTLRHLVQIRDGDCTFPPCTRHARESDFEHAGTVNTTV